MKYLHLAHGECRTTIEEAALSFLIVLAALAFLMVAAYRGYSVILFAPIAALGAVLFTDPSAVAPVFSGIFMEKMVGFVKLYFPVFMLGAVFGKVIEMSGFSKSIVQAAIRYIGRSRANAVIVAVCALLTYGGVSLFVVVFAVYPFAAELYRQSNIPKRLMPGAIALGAFSFTMDSLPGTPQIQNIIPTTFFKTTGWAAPVLGTIGSLFIIVVGLAYLEWRRRAAMAKGEGYGTALANEPIEDTGKEALPHPLIAVLPLVLVGVANFAFTRMIPVWYGGDAYTVPAEILPGVHTPVTATIKTVLAIWAVEAALLLGILLVVATAFRRVSQRFASGSKEAVGGALLAAMNTASEYGFGGVIAALPGFIVVSDALKGIPNPLVNAAVSVSSLAGITGSASGGMSIALAAMSDLFIQGAQAAHIPLEVLHRVVAMASGGMDTLPHNGAVITLLAVTGLTHRESYREIFAITVIKTLAVFFVIGVFYATGLV
jgi:H+/gluconate symporter-like permease